MASNKKAAKNKSAQARQARPPAKPAIKTKDWHRLWEQLQSQQLELEAQNQALRETQLLLETSRDRYADLYDFAPTGYITLNVKGVIEEINLTGAAMLGMERSHLIGMPFNLFVAKGDTVRYLNHLRQCKQSPQKVVTELELAVKGGGSIPVQLMSLVVQNFAKRTLHYRTVITDLTVLKQAQGRLRRTNRALYMLGECNHEMIYAADEPTFLQNICRIIVEVGGYVMAWVGFAEEDQKKTVHPAAQAGYEKGYLETLQLTWADKERGRGPTGRAIRSGKPVVCKNILLDPDFIPWREEALKRGYASSIAIPLVADQHILGALMVYASEPGAFDTEEEKLLTDLATDLAYGIITLRTRLERRRAEEALRFLSSQLLVAEEKERKRISQELHDGIGQSLSAIKYTLEQHLQKTVESPLGERTQSLTNIVAMTKQAVEEIRRICMDLRPSTLDDLGILATITWFCREFQQTYPDLLIQQEINLEEKEVPLSLKTVIYRTLQEALNNAAKHSQAKRVRVILERTDDALELTIHDDGRGFEVEGAFSADNFRPGLGLPGMRERVELSGGIFAVESVPGAGTMVRASWLARMREDV